MIRDILCHEISEHFCQDVYIDTYATGKYMEKNIWKAHENTRIWHIDLLDMTWHQPQTSIDA